MRAADIMTFTWALSEEFSAKSIRFSLSNCFNTDLYLYKEKMALE